MSKLMVFACAVPDFRRNDKGNIRHKLADVIMLMILARIAGHVGRAAILEFGKHNLAKFQNLGLLVKGVPSEPTLCRIENGIDDISFADKMQEFAELMRGVSMSFTKLIRFLSQKFKK